MTIDKPPACHFSSSIVLDRAASGFADMKAMFAAIFEGRDLTTIKRLAHIGGALAHDLEQEFQEENAG